MLATLSIKNYALIEELNVDFDKGFSIITGETGAGKSILLGALGLVLGKRADLSYLKDTSKKCIIEAEFNIDKYNLNFFFEEEDLDYECITTIRREILPSGKSRAFINDTPTKLAVLSLLSEKLIDIHSQHETLTLSDTKFQFRIIDSLASNEDYLISFEKKLSNFNALNTELELLKIEQQESKQQYEYNLHLFSELESANLVVGVQESMESTLSKLNNVEGIKQSLSEALHLSSNEEHGILDLVGTLKSKLLQIESYSKDYFELFQRIESLEIELKDITSDLEDFNENVEFNPNEIEKLNDRLQLIYDLEKKHSVETVKELLVIQEQLSEKVYNAEHADMAISKKAGDIESVSKELNSIAKSIHKNRLAIIPKFINELEVILECLGMKNARFEFNLTESELFLTNGKDNLELLFSANKGVNFGRLKKIASGGELSRIMLAVKSIVANYMSLPSIIFDEIDSGVSGEISNKMGEIMQNMSKEMQVISITHLPQIAAKGDHHYKVYKEENKYSNKIETKLKLLSNNDRVDELAEMLGGKNITSSAVAHAKELLN